MSDGWLCIYAGWAVFAVGVLVVIASTRTWGAWGACYALAVVLWFAPAVAGRRKR